MTDEPIDSEQPLSPPENDAPTTPVLEFTVLEIDNATGLAVVEFANPYYSGEFITTQQRPLLDEAGQPTSETEDYQVDEDPNPHTLKQIRVPYLANGSIDQDLWTERLVDQSRGVLARMNAARVFAV